METFNIMVLLSENVIEQTLYLIKWTNLLDEGKANF